MLKYSISFFVLFLTEYICIALFSTLFVKHSCNSFFSTLSKKHVKNAEERGCFEGLTQFSHCLILNGSVLQRQPVFEQS